MGVRDATYRDLSASVQAGGSRLFTAARWADVIDELVGDATRVALSPSLGRVAPQVRGLLDGHSAELVEPSVPDPVAAVADCDVGFARGELVVVETGSVLVDEHDLTDRSVSMLVRRLVLVVPAERVVADLEHAAAWLTEHTSGAGFASLITGPSRSADIERSLTIGVQGPSHVDVVVLEEAAW